MLSAISSLNIYHQKTFEKIEKSIHELENKIDSLEYYSIDLQQKLIDELVMISNTMLSDAKKAGMIEKAFPINAGKTIFCDYHGHALGKLAREMLYYVWNTIHEDIQSRGTEKTISYQIRAYIDNHYRERINLATFSEMFFVCKEHLAKSFKKTYGVSIYQYLIQTRMDNAVRLLVNSQDTIESIAQMVGYSDADSFCKSFKKHFSMLPSQYRKRQ